MFTWIPKKGSTYRTQTQMQRFAKKANKNVAAQRVRKQGVFYIS